MLNENTVSEEGGVTLDYTLYDLYNLDSDEAPILPVQLFLRHPAPDYGLSPTARLTYHTSFRHGNVVLNPMKQLRSKHLAQRYGFSAGKLNVMVLDPDLSNPFWIAADYDNMRRTFSQLQPNQQPILSLFTDVDLLQKTLTTSVAGAPVTVTRPNDFVSKVPHAINQEKHYELLSKRCLALSGLITPSSTIIDTLLKPEQAHDPIRLQSEVARMTAALDSRRLPFMIKLNQSLESAGAMKVLCEEDRMQAKTILTAHLRKALLEINPVSQHLHPCSIVIQDFIAGPAVSVSFFVTRKGRAVFVVCSEQHFTDAGVWTGGSVDYTIQNDLHRKYAKSLEDTAKFLHENGYYGPAGIDVMSESSEQYIIDLNARVTGTYHLGLLAGHFTRRGLRHVTFLKEFFMHARDDFEDKFSREIQGGSLVIIGWACDESLSRSHGAVTVGGRDTLELKNLLDRIQSYGMSGKLILKPIISTSNVIKTAQIIVEETFVAAMV